MFVLLFTEFNGCCVRVLYDEVAAGAGAAAAVILFTVREDGDRVIISIKC